MRQDSQKSAKDHRKKENLAISFKQSYNFMRKFYQLFCHGVVAGADMRFSQVSAFPRKIQKFVDFFILTKLTFRAIRKR